MFLASFQGLSAPLITLSQISTYPPPPQFESTCFIHNLASGKDTLTLVTSNVAFLVTLEFKKGIITFHMIFIDTLCSPMSHSFNLDITIHLLIILNVYEVLPYHTSSFTCIDFWGIYGYFSISCCVTTPYLLSSSASRTSPRWFMSCAEPFSYNRLPPS